MEIAITKISPNGQVVIPSEVRKDAGLKPATKFLVFNQGGTIMLKQLRTEVLKKEMQLVEQIERGERQIRNGKSVKANTKMSVKEIDDILMN